MPDALLDALGAIETLLAKVANPRVACENKCGRTLTLQYSQWDDSDEYASRWKIDRLGVRRAVVRREVARHDRSSLGQHSGFAGPLRRLDEAGEIHVTAAVPATVRRLPDHEVEPVAREGRPGLRQGRIAVEPVE